MPDRLQKKKQFFEPMKSLNYKTLADMGKASVVKTLSNREAQYKQQANVALQLLVLSQKQSEKIDIRELIKIFTLANALMNWYSLRLPFEDR